MATATVDQLAAGIWSVGVSAPGPFKDSTAPKGTAKVTVTATTQPVDPAAQRPTGRFWEFGGRTSHSPSHPARRAR